MAQVKVHNDNIYPYREKFRELDIDIPAKGFIVMDRDEADTFFGTMPPKILKTPDGGPDPRGFKMLRMESVGENVYQVKYLCNACRIEFPDEQKMVQHSLKDHATQIFTGNPEANNVPRLKSYDDEVAGVELT